MRRRMTQASINKLVELERKRSTMVLELDAIEKQAEQLRIAIEALTREILAEVRMAGS